MAGNTFGELFRITTFGESHGPGVGVVIDGVPPLLEISEADIQTDLDRRRPGQSKITTQRKEADQVEILSGIFEGKTTGAPLAMLIRNQDQRPKDYSNIMDVYRPGHADYTYQMKYGIRDYRGGGRSSGRETAARVAAGAVAKKYLAQAGIKVIAYTIAVGPVQTDKRDFDVIEQNLVRAPDLDAAEQMVQVIDSARKDCDSVGGVVEALVQGCPPGLGDPAFDKLNARLAHAVMSIGTIRGIEFGDGFAAALLKGSENNDPFAVHDGRVVPVTNHAGGILGGISTGADIILRAAVKPPSSIAKLQRTVNSKNEEVEIQVRGRHDPCLCPRIVPVIESMVALTLADCYLIQKSTRP